MVSKSLKNPLHRAKKRKFDHDLGCVRKFSSSVAQLLPVFYDLAYPGDKYELRTEMFTQLREIASPAMTHITEQVEWFFVPLKQICVTAPDSIFGIQDYHTTFLNKNDNTKGVVIPSFNAARLYEQVKLAISNKTYLDVANYNINLPFALDGSDVFLIPNAYNLLRLSQLLGFGLMFSDFENVTFSSTNKPLLLNPMFACAYQKIFFDCYRIDNRIENDQRYYNLDEFAVSGEISNTTRPQMYFCLHYRPWAKDYFTSVLPSPLIDFGSIGMQSTTGNETLLSFQNPLSVGSLNTNNESIDFSANLATLRGAFAVEKLMEITRRADKNYDSQVLAHFGFEVPKGILDHVYRVGSESAVVNIDEVFATAVGSDGDNSSMLGEKGGRGSAYGAPSRGIRFTAPCHGILMAIFSASPSVDYSNTRLDRLNTLRTREQYWQPEFDKLGMDAIYLYEFNFNWNHFVNNRHASVLGFNFRYMSSKLKLNDVSGIFFTSEQYQSWTTQRDLYKYFENYVVNGALDWSFFYQDPSFIDSIMILSFHPANTDEINYKSCFARDPLLHWFKFYVHKASEISNYSMPDL